MNRLEYLQSASLEDVAEFLCMLTDNQDRDDDKLDCCDICIARKYCKTNHNGFIDWLQKDNSRYIWE